MAQSTTRERRRPPGGSGQPPGCRVALFVLLAALYGRQPCAATLRQGAAHRRPWRLTHRPLTPPTWAQHTLLLGAAPHRAANHRQHPPPAERSRARAHYKGHYYAPYTRSAPCRRATRPLGEPKKGGSRVHAQHAQKKKKRLHKRRTRGPAELAHTTEPPAKAPSSPSPLPTRAPQTQAPPARPSSPRTRTTHTNGEYRALARSHAPARRSIGPHTPPDAIPAPLATGRAASSAGGAEKKAGGGGRARAIATPRRLCARNRTPARAAAATAPNAGANSPNYHPLDRAAGPRRLLAERRRSAAADGAVGRDPSLRAHSLRADGRAPPPRR